MSRVWFRRGSARFARRAGSTSRSEDPTQPAEVKTRLNQRGRGETSSPSEGGITPSALAQNLRKSRDRCRDVVEGGADPGVTVTEWEGDLAGAVVGCRTMVGCVVGPTAPTVILGFGKARRRGRGFGIGRSATASVGCGRIVGLSDRPRRFREMVRAGARRRRRRNRAAGRGVSGAGRPVGTGRRAGDRITTCLRDRRLPTHLGSTHLGSTRVRSGDRVSAGLRTRRRISTDMMAALPGTHRRRHVPVGPRIEVRAAMAGEEHTAGTFRRGHRTRIALDERLGPIVEVVPLQP